jgi:phage portal protein BeeE
VSKYHENTDNKPHHRAGTPAQARGYGMGAGVLLGSMRSGAPGQWSDNRLEQARHFLGVAYTAIRALCDGVASCEALVTTDRKPGDPQRAADPVRTRAAGTSAPLGTEHRWPVRADYPLARLLEDPNPQDTRADLFYEITLQRRLTGSALLWHVPNGVGLPAELYVIPTALANALPRSAQYPQGAWRVSPLTASGPFAMLPGPVASGGAVIPAEQVTQLKFKHPLYRYDGYSPLTAGAVQMDILEMIDRSRWSAFQRGVNTNLVLEVDPVKGATLKQEDLNNLQARLDEKYAGTENYGRPLVLTQGMTAKPWGVAAGSMGYESGWEQIRDFVLSLFGVPKGVIGITESTNYATLYAALKAFYLVTLRPDVQQISGHLTKFIARRFHPSLRIDLELPSLDDPQLLETQLANDDACGVRTLNERRALRNLPPYSGPEGDERCFRGAAAGKEEAKDPTATPGGEAGDSGAPKLDNPAGQGSKGPRGKGFSRNGTGRH